MKLLQIEDTPVQMLCPHCGIFENRLISLMDYGESDHGARRVIFQFECRHPSDSHRWRLEYKQAEKVAGSRISLSIHDKWE